MPSRSMPILCPLFAFLVLIAADTSLAASSNCTALSPLPSVLEVGEGLQQELQSPVAITRLAVGDPKIATELAFRVVAEEFPINVTDPNKVKNRAVASIAIATKYIGSLYVTPQNTKPVITADAIGTTKNRTWVFLLKQFNQFQ